MFVLKPDCFHDHPNHKQPDQHNRDGIVPLLWFAIFPQSLCQLANLFVFNTITSSPLRTFELNHFHLYNSGLTASKAECVNAPVINEFPLCLECEFIEYQSNEYGCGVIGKVVNVTASENVMTNGKLDMTLVNAIAFDPYTHGYYKVTERVGEAFKDGLKLKK